MNKPRTNHRRVKGRITKPGSELVTFGEMLRMIREMRGLSRDEAARRVGVHVNTISKIEKGFLEGISFKRVHLYMREIYATLIAIPMPFPSFIDHNAHRVSIIYPTYTPLPSNKINEPQELPQYNEPTDDAGGA